ncbi:MAG TPA: GntR family transcriptional regulator [Actinospica sp.]|jgi:DNA-binding GntR family transcriptional regulator|nr:GntR family transcriptional regulator [Actinospica sp.]
MSSAAERVAVILRDRITAGELTPGTRLIEESLGAELGVSRNTLREAFRLLTHERLLVYELNRGVFVRTLSEQDVVELYRVRRMIELGALRDIREPVLGKVAEAVDAAEKAAEANRWQDVGTADIQFHRALVELAGSARIEEFMALILAELRLVFDVMKDPRRFHEPYINRNREILAALENGDVARAEELLKAYLDDAERQLLAAYG